MTNEPSPRPWTLFVHDEQEGGDGEISICAEGEWIATMNLRRSTAKDDTALIVAAVNERAKFEEAHMKFPDLRPVIIAAGQRDAAIAECDRLRTAYADLWRAVKRIEAHSRIGLGTGLEVASSALHWVNTYASSAIRAAEKKGFAP